MTTISSKPVSLDLRRVNRITKAKRLQAAQADYRTHVDIPGQCLDPETIVLKANLEWVPLADLREGDAIWAFNEMPKSQARRTLITEVQGINWVQKPAIGVLAASGRMLVASKESRLLSYSGGGTMTWRRLETLIRPYQRGTKAGLAVWIPPWQQRSSFEDGWLSGMFDGEGSLSKRSRDGSSLTINISQNPGPLLERVKELLTDSDFQYSIHASNGQNTCQHLYIKGGTREFIRLLGMYRPQRLLAKLLASNCDLELWLTPDPIVDVTYVGMKDMIELQTGEGTHFANGFAVHNRKSEQSDDVEVA